MNNYKTFIACFALISLAACNVNNDSANNHQDRIDLAEAWLMAANSSKAEAIEMVEKNMAEDGVTQKQISPSCGGFAPIGAV